MQTAFNTLARAKLVKIKKTGLFKFVAAFNVTRRSEVTGKYIFPSEAKCDFVSGHISVTDLPRIMQDAVAVLRTNYIFYKTNLNIFSSTVIPLQMTLTYFPLFQNNKQVIILLEQESSACSN